MSPQEVLLAAADLLESEGWRQGEADTAGHGPRCVWGALLDIAFAPASSADSYTEAIEALEREAGVPREGAIRWNDQPGQTAENVIATLRAAAQ